MVKCAKQKFVFYDLFPEATVNFNNVRKFSYAIDEGILLHHCESQLQENFGYVRYLGT